jgi:hypothetical protein
MNFFFFHDGTSAVTEPFSRILSFFTMELRLSRSLSHEFFLFSRWNFGYQEALSHVLFFFFHNGISAITEPFSRILSFFTMEFRLSGSPFSRTFFLFSQWNFGYHGAFLTNSFFFHDGISAIRKPFLTNFFSFFTMEFRDTKYETRNLGEDSLYIYIRKSIYIGSASLKTLPLDLEPPLQGKEYGPFYSRTTIKT